MNNKVLLVDDEPKLLDGLRRQLSGRFDLTCATSGADALDQVEAKGPFAVVVSDVNMPGMDGIELMRELRRRAPGTARLILTGSSDFGVAVAAVNEGAVFRFHSKPISAADLAESIETALLRHQLDKQAGSHLSPDDALRRQVAELRQAVRDGQMRLFMQPQHYLADRRIGGAEGLIRWQHPERGLLGPGQFLGTAEAGGVMPEITAWALDTACAEIRRWYDLGLQPVRVAVNVTAADLADPTFPGRVRSLIDRYAINADRLALELTEGAALVEIERTRSALESLAVLGLEVSIDDFGTGYSSFGWLRHLPVDRLKIDRMFVTDIATEPEAYRVCAAIITLARDLGLTVVAEGVETAAQQEELVRAGCTAVQGYYLAKPMPSEDFPAWLDRWNADPY